MHSRILLTTALLLAVLTALSGPALAGPRDRRPEDDGTGAPARFAGIDSPASGFTFNQIVGLAPQPPAIHICKLAGSLPTGTPATIQLTGTHNGGPTVVTNTVDVGTTCRQNEFVNFGNQLDLNTQVFIQETAPPGSRLLPGAGCSAIPQGQPRAPLPCSVDANGVASFFLSPSTGGGQIDVVLTNGGADVSILKIDAPDPVVVGQNLEYEFAVANEGPEAAANVTVTDTLPATVVFQSLTAPAGVTCTTPPVGSTGTITCALGTMASGDEITVEMVVQPTAAVAGTTITNTAAVSSTTPDPHPANNISTVTTTVLAPTNTPTLTATATPTATHTATATNTATAMPTATNTATATPTATDTATAGPSPTATNTGGPTLTPTPTSTPTATLTATPTATATSTPTATNTATGTVTTATATIPPATQTSIVQTATAQALTATATTTANPATQTAVVQTATVQALTATATPTATLSPPATGTPTATPTPASNPGIFKLMAPAPVAVGAPIHVLLIVRSDGPGPATGVVVTDTLPPNTLFVSATPSQGSCTPAGSTVTCALGNMAVGAIVNIRMVLQVTPAAAGTTLVNTATVAANEFDIDPTDNTTTATVFVVPPVATEGPAVATATVVPSVTPAPLRLTKTGAPATAHVGDRVSYTVTVTNPGTTPVTGVLVSDTLPANAELVSATATVGACSGTVTLVCTLGTLAAGQSATVTIVIRPTPAAAGTTLTDTAVATAPGLPPVTATATTVVSSGPMTPPNVLPLLPPPLLVPPPPVPPSAIGGGGPPVLPEVPVIPEADSLFMLGVGLVLGGVLAGLRVWRRRRG
jgi:uncharacterized repeat protein (TIGR01451 family)